MAFGTGNTSMTLEELRQIVSDEEVISRYLNISKVPCIITSPLREDNKPSFGIYSKDGITIKWVDFANKEGGSVYDLLMKLWKLPLKDVINKVSQDFKANHSTSCINNITKQNKLLTKREKMINYKKIECKSREWRDYDLKYWESYGINITWLKYAEVYPISHKIVYKDNQRYVLGADKYAYAFVEHKEGETTIKIYQPFNQRGYKWSNSHNGSVISLWTKVPQQGEQICICSSLKDALCLWANTGIPAIAVQGEGYSLSSTACKELRRRFKKIYILFDNDKPGLEDGKKLSEQTGFTNLILPQFEGGKDISDLYKIKGKEEFKAVMSELFKTDVLPE